MSASILVTAKINPDLDGVACAYAYSRLLNAQEKNATGGVFGQMHAEAVYLVDRFGIDDVVHDPVSPFDDDMFAEKTKFAFENLRDTLMIDAKLLTIGVHRIGIAQLEILDLQRLAETRLDDILVILQNLKKEHQLDAVLLTTVDLKEGFNLFISPDATINAALAQALHVDFEGNIAKRAGVLLRKQLIPLLKAVMEGSDARL